jgi:DNA primase
LIFDGDEAGLRALRKSIVALEDKGLEAKAVALPSGKDPADMLKGPGIDELIQEPIEGFHFLLRNAQSRHNTAAPSGKEAILKELLPLLRSVHSAVKRDAYMRVVAETLGVSVESVRRDYEGGMRRRVPRRENRKGTLSDDLYLMIAVSGNLEYFSVVRNDLSVDDLKDPRARDFYLAMEECFREERTDLDCLLAEIKEESLKKLLFGKLASDEFAINPEKIIRDTLFLIKRRSLFEKREVITSRLRKAEKEEPWRIKDLLEEKMLLDDQIEELKVMKDVRTTR